jgi:hypothetical protein
MGQNDRAIEVELVFERHIFTENGFILDSRPAANLRVPPNDAGVHVRVAFDLRTLGTTSVTSHSSQNISFFTHGHETDKRNGDDLIYLIRTRLYCSLAEPLFV